MDEQPSTYFVHDPHHAKAELRRLIMQDQMITAAMGGVLAEQPDPSAFHTVLDIACGPGGWVIEAAKQYPDMHLTGIDISNRMITYARAQANAQQVSDRVEFRVMDTLFQLQFSPDSFDLVNLRFGVSFIRQWEWPHVISEMLRVTKPGGVVRITDSEILQHSKSSALKTFQGMVLCALHRAGHLFAEEALGITLHLASLLQRYGVRAVQTKLYCTTYQSGRHEGNMYVEDVCSAMKTLKPFIQKWGCADPTYEDICQMAREQMARPDFYAVWQLLTVWGKKRDQM